MSDRSDRAAASCVARVAFQIASWVAPYWTHRPEYVRRAYYDRVHRMNVQTAASRANKENSHTNTGYAAESAFMATLALDILRRQKGNAQGSVNHAIEAARRAAVTLTPIYSSLWHKLNYEYGAGFRACSGALPLLMRNEDYRMLMHRKPERKRFRQRKVES